MQKNWRDSYNCIDIYYAKNIWNRISGKQFMLIIFVYCNLWRDFAENDIFTKIAKWVQKRALYYKWLIFIMFLVGLYVTFKLYITCDVTVCTELNYGIVPLLWIVFAYLYVSKIPIVNTILEFIGKHSMNIFYVHIFFRNNYCYNFIYSFKNSFLIATILFLLSLVTSYGIEWAKKAVKYDYVWEKFENKVLNIN